MTLLIGLDLYILRIFGKDVKVEKVLLTHYIDKIACLQ